MKPISSVVFPGKISSPDDLLLSVAVSGEPLIKRAEQQERVEQKSISDYSVYLGGSKLDQVPLEHRSIQDFYKALPEIMHHSVILKGCDALEVPVVGVNTHSYQKIRTEVCLTEESSQRALGSITDNELLLLIYKTTLNDKTLSFGLVGHDRDGSRQVIFSFHFTLEFNAKNQLIMITPNWTVDPAFQRQGICKRVSLNILEQIYKYLGSDVCFMDSGDSEHIATVKFYYPLDGYYSGKKMDSLRDVDLRKNIVDPSSVIIGEKTLSKINLTRPRCPQSKINLENLLLQYRFREAFERL